MNVGLLEVGADICGAASAVLLLVPTRRIYSARKLLHERMAAIRAKAHSGKTDSILKELLEADQATGQYDTRDARLLKWGVWTLLFSFVLKLIFHGLTKSA